MNPKIAFISEPLQDKTAKRNHASYCYDKLYEAMVTMGLDVSKNFLEKQPQDGEYDILFIPKLTSPPFAAYDLLWRRALAGELPHTYLIWYNVDYQTPPSVGYQVKKSAGPMVKANCLLATGSEPSVFKTGYWPWPDDRIFEFFPSCTWDGDNIRENGWRDGVDLWTPALVMTSFMSSTRHGRKKDFADWRSKIFSHLYGRGWGAPDTVLPDNVVWFGPIDPDVVYKKYALHIEFNNNKTIKFEKRFPKAQGFSDRMAYALSFGCHVFANSEVRQRDFQSCFSLETLEDFDNFEYRPDLIEADRQKWHAKYWIYAVIIQKVFPHFRKWDAKGRPEMNPNHRVAL